MKQGGSSTVHMPFAPSHVTTSRDRDRHGWVLLAVAFLGITLIQLAWALVVPPFRAIDEHDHAFRAGAVARGEWLPEYTRVADGRGDIVTPPADLVTAAQPICTWLVYTSHDDCFAIADVAGGRVQVGSAAARYNPAFYWLMGNVARPWQGAESLYAMRALAAAASALLLATALLVTRRAGKSIWPSVALLAVLTPTATYTTSVAAPNGFELSGAVLLWSCLLGLLRTPLSRRRSALLVAGAVTGAVPLLTVRSIGPLWFGLIIGTWLVLGWTRGRRSLASVQRPLLTGAVLVVAFALSAGVSWTLVAGTNDPGNESVWMTDSPWPRLPGQIGMWLLQVIAAVPLRDEPSPPVVYAIVLVLFLLVAVAGWRSAGSRARLAMALLLTVSVVVPATLTVLTYAELGTAWQGRYGWPYSLGFLLIAGYALEKRRGAGEVATERFLAGGVAAMMCVATVVAQLAVLRKELLTSPLAHDPSWIRPSSLLVVALTGSGFLLLAVATCARRSHTPEPSGIPSDRGRPLASAHDLAP